MRTRKRNSYRSGAEVAGESISLDELMARQEQQGLLSIVGAVADRPDHVKITPYATGSGPLRSHAFVVPKDAVESVTVTEESHTCCGKKTPVVETTFADPILNDVLRQLSSGFPWSAPRRFPRFTGPAPAPHRHSRMRTARSSDPFYCDVLWHDCRAGCQRAYPDGGVELDECLSACDEGYLDCMNFPSG